ncbi:MAG: non-heme iron oxygenase ferredoxin subunit [Chloroflexota bacterium]|nr:non-heme iron oxygenase ferredoxin subunit [Chloroflexota bacterium]
MSKQAWTLSKTFEGDRFAWLDRLAQPLQAATHKAFGSGRAGQEAKRWLNGVPVRHRVHPAMIILPLSGWTMATVLDALDTLSSGQEGSGYSQSADVSVAFGVVTALPAASAGLADWVDTDSHHRRVGMAHATLNTVALTLYSTSLALRLSGKARGTARALGLVGYGAVMLSGALGGDLTYNLGVNVPFYLNPKPEEDWTDVAASDAVPDSAPVVVDVGRVSVLLWRQNGRVLAVQDWCTHAAASLSEGQFDGDKVTCPWHGSQFSLVDGCPLNGPASAPLRTFEVREELGRISVRPSYEGQDWPIAR